MFRIVFPFIIKISRLYMQQQAFVKQILLLLASGNEMELSFPLASSSSTCLAYAFCRMYSHELLMMVGKTVRNM